MEKKIKKIKKVHPITEIDELKNDLGKSISLDNLYQSEGGQILIDGLVTDITDGIDILCANVSSFSHTELIVLICKVKERIDLVKILTNAKSEREGCADILAEKLAEQKDTPPKDMEGTV